MNSFSTNVVDTSKVIKVEINEICVAFGFACNGYIIRALSIDLYSPTNPGSIQAAGIFILNYDLMSINCSDATTCSEKCYSLRELKVLVTGSFRF